jgi:hypothetical protein
MGEKLSRGRLPGPQHKDLVPYPCMIVSAESMRGSAASPHSVAEIAGAVSRLFNSSEPSSALIVSCPVTSTPAVLSIRREDGATPLVVILTDRRKTAAEQQVKDFFRRRAIPLQPERAPACTSGIHPLIYRLTVPVDAVAGIVCDLLETCFQIGEREPLDFNFVRA